MNRRALCCIAVGMVASVVFNPDSALAFEDGYGNISGQFVFEGDLPKPKLIVQKGDATVKDPSICAAENIENEELVVDPTSKGIANVFVFLRKAPKNVHPSLKASKEKDVVFDQKGCKFLPHALFVRTDQVVLVKSMDNIGHNTHTVPLRNDGVNLLISANERKGVPFVHKSAESMPIPVKCDIHSWMKAHWLILDHPYAAITDKDGKFKIENLPVGEHEFMVWQEPGWVGIGDKTVYKVTVKPGGDVAGANRGIKVTVKSGGSTDLGTMKISFR